MLTCCKTFFVLFVRQIMFIVISISNFTFHTIHCFLKIPGQVTGSKSDDETFTKYDVDVYANQSSAINGGVIAANVESNTVISDERSLDSHTFQPTESLVTESSEMTSTTTTVPKTKGILTGQLHFNLFGN